MLDVGRLGGGSTMSHLPQQPGGVIEQSLETSWFDCCGDENLFPFKCWSCARPLVLCYECDTLYSNLGDLTQRRLHTSNDSPCPGCGSSFDTDLMRSPRHRISFATWREFGLDHLLRDPSPDDLLHILASSCDQLADWLERGMQSTAKSSLVDYRNLAEAIIDLSSSAQASRTRGQAIGAAGSLSQAMLWHATLLDGVDRSYALLGITDALYPPTVASRTPPN